MFDARHLRLPVAPRRDVPQSGSLPRGFTLLEVLLVLALMVAVTALASTNLRSSFRQQRLRKAAQQVRTEWTRARVEAIKTGRVQVFHHALQYDRYLVVSQQSVDDVPVELLQGSQGYGSNLSSTATSRTSLGRSAPSGLGLAADNLDLRQRQLPDGVVFLAADVQIDQRSVVQLRQSADPKIITQQMMGLRSETSQPEQWGMPIYFFPDGTSSTAQVMLMNDFDEAVRIYLRGLTGLVRVGNVETSNTWDAGGGPR
jgi:prepilin-type N-terminal cleavage/methylation domain-containing protein